MRKALAITLFIILILFVATIPAQSAEDGDIGCATAWFEMDGSTAMLIDQVVDEGVNVSTVGYYLWVQYAYEPSSEINLLSYDLTGVESPITICTGYVSEGNDIPNAIDNPGLDDYSVTYEVQDNRVVVVSSVEPHPEVADAWITDNGFEIR